MLGFFKKIFRKKNNNKMDTERLISLKENFTNQKFQWIKTNKKGLLGKVVKCRDIMPKGRGFEVVFNDGSTIDSELVTRNLMMLTDGMEPLTMGEVSSINGPSIPNSAASPKPSGIGSGPIKMPDDLKQFQTPPSQKTTSPSSQMVKEGKNLNAKESPVQATNMFSMFNADETNLNISVNLKLPNKKLLKMMYENADNKETFLLDLSQYVYSKINNNIVKESLKKTLVPAPKKRASIKEKSSSTTITVTEIKENNE
tara:strand:- start:110 stop:877 length:768 start_codon:yes stop_codon:yes gene_type:complete